MTVRGKKKAEARKRELIHQLLDLTLDINGSGERNQELTRDLPTAFFQFSGHIAKVDVDIHDYGWRSYHNRDENINVYTYETANLENSVKELQAIRDRLITRKA